MLSFQVFQHGFSFSLRKSGTFLLKVSELLRSREAPGFLLPFLDKTYKNAMNQRPAFAKADDFYGCRQDSSLRRLGNLDVPVLNAAGECSVKCFLPKGKTGAASRSSGAPAKDMKL